MVTKKQQLNRGVRQAGVEGHSSLHGSVQMGGDQAGLSGRGALPPCGQLGSNSRTGQVQPRRTPPPARHLETLETLLKDRRVPVPKTDRQ